MDLKNAEVIGWAIFTRNGGEVIEQVSERNIEIAVGPSETRPQLRVRFAPDDACDLADEERFLFSAARADPDRTDSKCLPGSGVI